MNVPLMVTGKPALALSSMSVWRLWYGLRVRLALRLDQDRRRYLPVDIVDLLLGRIESFVDGRGKNIDLLGLDRSMCPMGDQLSLGDLQSGKTIAECPVDDLLLVTICLTQGLRQQLCRIELILQDRVAAADEQGGNTDRCDDNVPL